MKTQQFNSLKMIFIYLLSMTFLFGSCAQENNTASQEKTTATSTAKPKLDIHTAILKGDLATVQEHIKAGSDLNVKEPMSGSSPLITAATFNKVEIAKVLINAKADLTTKNNDGSTALHTAAFFGRIEIVQLLIDAKADKTIKNNFGATARETVMGDFAQMKPIYEMLTMQLQPMGFTLDLEAVEKARPVIAMMLQ